MKLSYDQAKKILETIVNTCVCCKNKDTQGEIRTWDKIDWKYIVIPPIKVTVCSHCKNNEWEGRAFIPREITEKEILDYIKKSNAS